MLARLLRLVLLFELFAYLAGGVLLVKSAGWRPSAAILSMIFLALAWRAAVVLKSLSLIHI